MPTKLPTALGLGAGPVPVEVRARFDGQWHGGFEVVEVVERVDPAESPPGLRVRRSGGDELPVLFDPSDVRPLDR
jgi:hypothetical protein